jgi:transcriptional regulator with XRE-family HTH domain
MLLTEDQAQERLNSSNNLANRFSNGKVVEVEESENGTESEEIRIQEILLKRPKRTGVAGLSVEQRDEIALRARAGEHQSSLAEEFGISQPNVSYIESGKTKGISEDKVNKQVAAVQDKALQRLMSALNLLDEDKLSGCSAKDLSTIASNMGRVVEKTLPKTPETDRINLVIYAPELKPEKSYKTVEI